MSSFKHALWLPSHLRAFPLSESLLFLRLFSFTRRRLRASRRGRLLRYYENSFNSTQKAISCHGTIAGRIKLMHLYKMTLSGQHDLI